jgi:hypothetical protein
MLCLVIRSSGIYAVLSVTIATLDIGLFLQIIIST